MQIYWKEESNLLGPVKDSTQWVCYAPELKMRQTQMFSLLRKGNTTFEKREELHGMKPWRIIQNF
jgi:hypothetical protein